jgi:DNA repair protein RecO (recombination protein O)
MSGTYQASGIILKGMPLGEADRLVTILTPEYGLVRAVAPGARKYKSSLRGRCELFVVNNFLLVGGRSLDRIIQAETIESYPKLSQDLAKLTAGHYLAELVLAVALSEQPQVELYELFREHLRRVEQIDSNNILSCLCQGVFHILAVAGIAPRVYNCCVSGKAIETTEKVGFSFDGGGVINLNWQDSPLPKIDSKLNSREIILLQQLGEKEIIQTQDEENSLAWINIERLLRDYTQYHVGQSFRSSALVDDLSPLEF